MAARSSGKALIVVTRGVPGVLLRYPFRPATRGSLPQSGCVPATHPKSTRDGSCFWLRFVTLASPRGERIILASAAAALLRAVTKISKRYWTYS